LVVTALSLILADVAGVGYLFTTIATYTALALIIMLIYNIGRILYR